MKSFVLLVSLSLVATSCSYLPKRDSQAERIEDLNEMTKGVDVPTIEGSLSDSGEKALSQGDPMKAIYYYDQLVKKNPENLEYKYKYAEALRRRGTCTEALNYYGEVLKKKPDDLDATEGRALCLVSLGEFEKAGPILTDIIHKDTDRWKSVNAAGLIFAINKKFKEANQYFDLAAKVSDNNPTVLNNQALTKALMGNYDDAIKLLKEASIKSSENPGQKRSVDLNLALVYGIAKDIDNAESAARPHLTRPQLYNNLGIYAELGKDKELARTYLNKALMGTPVYYDKAWDNLEKLNAGRK